MLLARALVTVESTASVVDPELTLADLAHPYLPELRRSLLLDPHTIEEAWKRNRFDYLELALELPEFVARMRSGGSGVVAPGPPSPRRLALASAFVAGLAGGLVGAALSRGRRSPRR